MTDLRERFDEFRDIDPPDLWDQIEQRAATPRARPARTKRLVTVVAAAAVAVAFAFGSIEVLTRTVWPDGSGQPVQEYEYEQVAIEAGVLAATDLEQAREVVESAGYNPVSVPLYVIPQEREVSGPIGYAYLRAGTNDVELGVYTDPSADWDLSGDKPGGSWTTFTAADGLASDCLCGGVAVASDGAVYAGSGKGLSRFDGSSWSVLLDGQSIESIVADRDGGAWVFAADDGYNYTLLGFDGENWTTYPTVDMGAIAVAPDGTVWLVAGPVSRLENGRFVEMTTGASVWEVTVGGDGVVWAAGPEGGLWRYDGIWAEMADGHGVEALGAGPDGRLWAGYDAASVYDGEAWTVSLDDSRIVEWAFEPDGTVWAASRWFGAFRFDGTGWSQYTTADGLASDELTSVAVGPDGSVWFGTENAGVSRFTPTP